MKRVLTVAALVALVLGSSACNQQAKNADRKLGWVWGHDPAGLLYREKCDGSTLIHVQGTNTYTVPNSTACTP